MKKRILVTGGTGRFGSILKRLKTNYELLFPSKITLDITNLKSLQKYMKVNYGVIIGMINIMVAVVEEVVLIII